MKFAKYTFLLSAIYGLAVLLPNYFLEVKTGPDNPPLANPEFFYGFIGLASVFQIVFLIISSDPVKYRPLMIVAVLEKLSFGIPAAILYAAGRLEGPFFLGGMIDLFLGVLFAVSFVLTGKRNRL